MDIKKTVFYDIIILGVKESMSNKKKIKTKKKKEVEKVDTFTQSIRDTLKNMGRTVNPYQEKMLVQLLKLFLVGGIATILDIIIYCILCNFIDCMIANAISMIVTVLIGLFIGIKYIYDKPKRKNNIIQYLVLNIIGFLITEGLIYYLVIIKECNKILIKILAIILVLIIKILLKKFVFLKKDM